MTNSTVKSAFSSPRLELLVLAALALLVTLVFWSTDLDLQAAGLFYQLDNPADPWPHSDFWLWDWFYHGVPVLAAVLALGSLFILVYSSVRGKWLRYKLAAGCVFLTILVGPGLLVNAIFKDHWGRPRPNQIVEFGGHMQHIPPLKIGESRKGESFPAGHPSIGFSLVIFWLLLRRRRPGLAKLALLAAISLGLLMGVGRMAAGGHFLSDVLFSGLFTTFAAILVFYYILRVPQRQTDAAPLLKTPAWQIAGYVVVGAGVLAGSLFGLPVDQNLHYTLGEKDMSAAPRIITLNIDQANVDIELRGEDSPFFDVKSSIRGFGIPTNTVQTSAEHSLAPVPQIHYSLAHKGIYSELNSVIKVQVATKSLERLVVQVQQGDISVSRAANLTHLPQLELRTVDGQIYQPSERGP